MNFKSSANLFHCAYDDGPRCWWQWLKQPSPNWKAKDEQMVGSSTLCSSCPHPSLSSAHLPKAHFLFISTFTFTFPIRIHSHAFFCHSRLNFISLFPPFLSLSLLLCHLTSGCFRLPSNFCLIFTFSFFFVLRFFYFLLFFASSGPTRTSYSFLCLH